MKENPKKTKKTSKRISPKKQKFSLKEEYTKCWDYLKKTKKYIMFIIFFFILTALVGFFFKTPELISQEIFKLLEEILAKTSGMNQGELTSFIFFNNLQSSFMGMIFGFILGIFPLIGTITNGYLLGFVARMAVAKEGFVSLLSLLPHGIFELPAIFISLGMGLKFGTFLFKKQKQKTFEDYLWNSTRVFVFIVIPLLIIAAIIEASLIIK